MINYEILNNLLKYLINHYTKFFDNKKLNINNNVRLELKLKPIKPNYDINYIVSDKTKTELCLKYHYNDKRIKITKDNVLIEFKLIGKNDFWNCFTFFLHKYLNFKNNNKLMEREMDNFLQRYKLSVTDVVSNVQKILIENI